MPVTAADVWIVVLNWNRCDDTLACVASLRAAKLDGARIVVVDNGSRDGSAATVAAQCPDVTVLPLARNEGYAGCNNAGIRHALAHGAGAVLLLNNDATVAPDFLEPLVWTLNGKGRVAAASSAILRHDRPELLDCAYLELYFGHGIVRRRGVNAMPGEGFDVVRTVDAGIGCSFLMSAEALRTVGLLDEAYFAYHEEVDWCFRARRAGYQVVYQPYSRVYHHGSRSTEPDEKPDSTLPRVDDGRPQLPNPIPLPWNPVRTYLGARNTVRFMRAHGTVLQQLYFVWSSAYALPLELLAVILDRESDYKIGAFGYLRALALLGEGQSTNGAGPARRGPSRYLRGVAALPRVPAAIRRAHRAGRTAQVVECLRGLWDGVLDRPLPLERLGLR